MMSANSEAATPSSAPSSSSVTPLTGWLSLPNTYQHHLPGFSCFGCASDNPAGLRLEMQVHEKEALFRTAPFVFSHSFSGWPGMQQGGLQGAAMDCLAEWACMYLSKSIGFTTRFDLTFLKGAPAAPPSSHDAAAAHIRLAPPLPQSLPLSVQVVCAARPRVHPRQMILDLWMENAAATDTKDRTVYCRGVVYMLLPSAAQVARLFGSDAATAQFVQASLEALPRPNTHIMHEGKEAQQSQAAGTHAPNLSLSKKAAAVSKASSPKQAAPRAAPTTFAELIKPPAFPDVPSEWISLPDPLTDHIENLHNFGFGMANPRGFQCRFEFNTRTGALRTFIYPSACLAGFPGMLHGGVALVPMDCLGGWCVMMHQGQVAFTSTMQTLYLESAPVPKQDQRVAKRPAHSHTHREQCHSPAGEVSPCLMSPAEAPYRLLIQGELIRMLPGGRQAEVVVNLYDANSAQKAPRLCITSKAIFTLATPSMVQKLMGDQYWEGIQRAMEVFKQMREKVTPGNAAPATKAKL
jgi:hypothetical protein